LLLVLNVWRILKKADAPMKKITIPKKLVPLIKAFSADEQSARLLVIEAAETISKVENLNCFSYDRVEKEMTKEEVEGIIALMKGIAPLDTMEMIYGAQIISSHLMGLRLLSHNHSADQPLGLKLLRFSNEAMSQLQKKRAVGN
jgi:hypothetical protein